MPTAYTDDALRKLLSKLNQLAEDFIAYQEYNNPTDKHLYFLKACNSRGLSKHFAAADRQTNAIIEQKEKSEGIIRDYQSRFWADFEKDSYQYKNDKVRTQVISAMNNLDNYYTSQKLQLYLLHFSTNYSQHKAYTPIGFKKFITYTQKNIEQDAMMQLNYSLAVSFNNIDKEGQTAENINLEYLLQKHKQNLSTKQIYIIGKNISTKLGLKINAKDEKKDIEKLSAIYRLLDEKKLLVRNKKIPVNFYKNISTINLRAGGANIEWAYNFIETNKKYVDEVHRENVYQYCMAYHSFVLKKFEKSLEYLQKIGEIEPNKGSASYILNLQLLKLQNYYELGDIDNFFKGLNDFRKKIKECSFMSYQVLKSNSNTLSMLNHIFKLRKGDRKKGKMLLEKISIMKNVYGRSWLIQITQAKMQSQKERKPVYMTQRKISQKNN